MKLRMISFTRSGALLGERLYRLLQDNPMVSRCEVFTTCQSAVSGFVKPLHVPLRKWTAESFVCCDALVFIGASGIAVRSIAPFLKGKEVDPAVLVMDETGRFVIPLLSGHIGGANRLANQFAALLGAQSVVTTATDCHGRFAVDSWAVQHGLHVYNVGAVKTVSMAILEGKRVGLSSDFPIAGQLPEELYTAQTGEVGVRISLDCSHPPFQNTLFCIPKCIALGIGCRRGTAQENIYAGVVRALSLGRIPLEAVEKVCSIDLKREESGLKEFCRRIGAPLETFSAAALSRAVGQFAASPFVERVTGVDNVCERAAVLGSGGNLLIAKQVFDGVTVAVAQRPFIVEFRGRFL